LASQGARFAAPPGGIVPIEDEDDQYYDDVNPKNTMEAKQNLLHLLSAEILIKTRLRRELIYFRSQVDALYLSLYHRTIDNVLGFFRVS